MNIDVFHRVTIGSVEFFGWVSFDGPRISSEAGGSVHLGPCGIRHFEPAEEIMGVCQYRDGWYIVKYTSEIKIPLRGFSEVEAQRLSTEFGIRMRCQRIEQSIASVGFFDSVAFEGLKTWVKDNPCKAKRIISLYDQDYLPNWYERALS